MSKSNGQKSINGAWHRQCYTCAAWVRCSEMGQGPIGLCEPCDERHAKPARLERARVQFEKVKADAKRAAEAAAKSLEEDTQPSGTPSSSYIPMSVGYGWSP